MKRKTAAQMALMATLILSATAAGAAISQPSPHRKVDAQGIGNCVFGASELSYQKDSSYQLLTQFTAPQTVHVRCYFPKTLQEYTSNGSVYNSLRDRDLYWASIGFKGEQGTVRLTASTYGMTNPASDQQRFDIDGTAENTDFGLRSFADSYGATAFRQKTTDYAMNVGNYVKAMAHSAKKYPFTASFCVDVYTKIADKSQQETKYDEYGKKWVTRDVPIEKDFLMARGCFDYTINSPGDVSWSPEADKKPANNSSGNLQDQAVDLLKGLF